MEKEDEYINQLKEIFVSCCSDGHDCLNKEQLLTLCELLSLDSPCLEHVVELSFPKSYFQEEIKFLSFDRFCDYFITALSGTSDPALSEESDFQDQQDELTEEKVRPRLVRGGKSYGRKSLPHKFEDVTNNYNITEEKYGSDDNARAVESDHKSGDMMTSSDDEVAPKRQNNSVYRESKCKEERYFDTDGQVNGTLLLGRPDGDEITSSKETFGYLADASAHAIDSEDSGPNLFSALALDDSGGVEVDDLCELWKRGGIKEPLNILQALDLQRVDGDLIDSNELSVALEKEVLPLLSSPLAASSTMTNTMICALISGYKHQLFYVNSQLDHYRNQAEKMKDDLEKSEIRNSKIIEEVDDRYLSMDQQNERQMSVIERRWSQNLNLAQHNFEREREAIMSQYNAEIESLNKEIDGLHANESTLRRKIEAVEAENNSLTRESNQVFEKFSDAEKEVGRLKRDLECLLAAKTIDTSDSNGSIQEEKFTALIREYAAENRNLADRNDELIMEVDVLRGKIRHQDAYDRYGNQDIYEEVKITSPKRKRASRRKYDDILSDSMDLNHYRDEESEILALSLENSKVEEESPTRSLTNSTPGYVIARMSELERLVEALRRDKRQTIDQFIDEKANLRAEIEREFQSKFENLKGKSSAYDDNKATEEQHNMTLQLLKAMTQQREELEAKYSELKERCERRQDENHQTEAEFAEERSKITRDHAEEIKVLQHQLEAVNHRLRDERATRERFAQQLKNERLQHKEALSAHQEVIQKLERAATSRESDGSNFDQLRELTEQHNMEVAKLKLDHESVIEAAKRKAEEVRSEMSDEIQKSPSMCVELERLQESVRAEQNDMHERVEEMRAAFEREADELKRLLDSEKAQLRQQLREEVDLLRQSLAEETEKAIRRKKQLAEAEEEDMKKRFRIEEERNEELEALQEEVEDLKVRNRDLELLLAKSSEALQEQQEEFERIKGINRDSDVFLLEERVQHLNEKLTGKEQMIIALRKELDELMDETKEKMRSLSSLQARFNIKANENSQLHQENSELTEKMRLLERERLSNRIENAGLSAKCSDLTNCSDSPPMPSPRSKHHHRKEKEQKTKQEEETRERIENLEKEIVRLREELAKKSAVRERCIEEDDTSEAESVASNSGENLIKSLRSRLNRTRSQLSEQMKKSKDLYYKLSKTDILVKELYCENANLMRALQVTEARQKGAERKLLNEEDRRRSLALLLKQITPNVT